MRERIRTASLFAGLLVLLAAAGSGAQDPVAVPESVVSAEEDAEDIIDFLLAGDWAQSRAIADSIVACSPSIAQTMETQGIPLSTIDGFSYFVQRLRDLSSRSAEPVWAAITANQITGILIDLEGHDASVPPRGIAWLDYLGREVVLWARVAAGETVLPERLMQIDATWATLEPQIRERSGGPAVAADVERTLAAMHGSTARKALIEQGMRLLDLVDEMEALYAAPSSPR